MKSFKKVLNGLLIKPKGLCPRSPIGSGNRLKPCPVWVRIPPRTQGERHMSVFSFIKKYFKKTEDKLEEEGYIKLDGAHVEVGKPEPLVPDFKPNKSYVDQPFLDKTYSKKHISEDKTAVQLLISYNKTYEIFEYIIEKCFIGEQITFEQDLMGDSFTIKIKKEDGTYHTHVGWPGATMAEIIDCTYNLLINNQGLSWVKDE